MMRFVKSHWGLFLVLFLSFFTIRPLLHMGFFPVHDNTQVQRVFEMGKSLSSGMLPVRWVQDLGYGYGYPIFTFYAPLAYYVGGLFTLLSLSALLSTKLMFGIGIVLSGVTMYFLARSVWGELGGTLSGLLYLFAPYHALDIYVRGDVSEFWAYAFLPLAVYGIVQSAKYGKFRYVVLGALGFAGIILSHNLSAFMVTPFLAIFAGVFILRKREKSRWFPLLIFGFGFLLAAFYFVPVPFEMKYTNVLSQVGGTNDFHRHFVCLSQLWYSPWGFGGSIPGCIDGISFALGKIYIVLFILSLLSLAYLFRKKKKEAWFALIAAVGTLFSLFMLLPYSVKFWNLIPQLAFLQYPWRYFVLVFFFLSFFSGSVLFILEKQSKVIRLLQLVLFVGIVGVLIGIQGKYFAPSTYTVVPVSFYTNTDMLRFTTSKISDEYMPKMFTKPQNVSQLPGQTFATNDGTIDMKKDTTQQKTALVAMHEQGMLRMNIAYFPAWQAWVDGKKGHLQQGSNGMWLILPKGKHTVTLRYTETTVELAGDMLTLAGIGILIVGIIIAGKKRIL